MLLKCFSCSSEQSKPHKENKILWVHVLMRNSYGFYSATHIILVHYILNSVSVMLDILFNGLLSFHTVRKLSVVTGRITGIAYDTINIPAHSS